MDKRTDQIVAELESILREQVEGHEALLSLLVAQRGAVASADARQVAQLCTAENQRVQRIAELEKQRLTLTADLTLALAPGAAEPLPLLELAGRLAEPQRGKLLVLRQQLRQRMEAVRREAALARRASESLVRHMHGLIQTIGGAVSGVATYGRGGARPQAALALSTFSTTA